MPRYKGTRYEMMRKIIRSHGPNIEKTFIDKLEPLEKEKYLHAQPVNWFPVEEEPETGTILQAGAEVLFPGDPDGLVKIGILNAEESMTGIYRFFMKIPSAEFVVKRAAKIWHTYQDTGEATIAYLEKTKLQFVVKMYPSLRADFRQYLRGYIKGIVQMGRVKSVEVTHNGDDPNEWKWDIKWVE